jgi:hypothetical protein
MKRVTIVFVALLGWSQAMAAEDPRAGFAGMGAIRIGMTTSELGTALGRPIEKPTEPDEAGCFYVAGDSKSSFSVMVMSGRVVRIDVQSTSIASLRGARIGDTVEVVRRLYGHALEEQPHFYLGRPDLYLTVFSSDRRMALRFETHNGVVSTYYFGYAEPTQYVEGCS